MPRAWEEGRLRDVRFLDRINYSDEECLDCAEEGEKAGGKNTHDLIIGRDLHVAGGGGRIAEPDRGKRPFGNKIALARFRHGL
jgi:hypothetical protein